VNIKKELMQIFISALLLALCIEVGWISPAHSYWGNVATAVVMYVLVRILAYFLS
jgi:uncharacterized membrane protein